MITSKVLQIILALFFCVPDLWSSCSSLVSTHYLKPLCKGIKLSNQEAKLFDDLKVSSRSQSVKFKVDYSGCKEFNHLIQQERTVLNGTKGHIVDAPAVVEGQLTVSF